MDSSSSTQAAIDGFGDSTMRFIQDMRARLDARRAGGCERLINDRRCGIDAVPDEDSALLRAREAKLPIADWHRADTKGWWTDKFLCRACDGAAAAEVVARHRKAIARHLADVDHQIPGIFKWVRPDAPEITERIPPPALAQAKKALLGMVKPDPSPAVLTLTGAAGQGKTSLAVYLLRGMMHAAQQVEFDAPWIRMICGTVFVSARELARERRDAATAKDRGELYEEGMKAALLVIDDLGAERHGMERVIDDPLGDLIADRFQAPRAPRPTIVTTGLSVDDVQRLYGGGIVRRIFSDEGLVKTIHLGDGRR